MRRVVFMGLATVLLTLVSANSTIRAEEELTHTKEPVSDIKKAVDEKKAVIVDVREKAEWDEGHVKNAFFIPLSGLKAQMPLPTDLPKDKPVYVHCRVGARAMTAAQLLKKQGYDARPMKQNVDDFGKAGFEIAK